MPFSGAVRQVALIEALKGGFVVSAASGFFALIHHDVQKIAALLADHAHLNPASKYPKILIDVAVQMIDPRLWQLAAGAAVYSIIRFAESYGLYQNRAWAEVLAAGSEAV